MAAFVFAMALNARRLLTGPSLVDRILALDTLYIDTIALLVLLGIQRDTPLYFEAALVIAMLGFASTVVQVPVAWRYRGVKPWPTCLCGSACCGGSGVPGHGCDFARASATKPAACGAWGHAGFAATRLPLTAPEVGTGLPAKRPALPNPLVRCKTGLSGALTIRFMRMNIVALSAFSLFERPLNSPCRPIG